MILLWILSGLIIAAILISSMVLVASTVRNATALPEDLAEQPMGWQGSTVDSPAG